MAAPAAAGSGEGPRGPLLDDLMPWSVRPLRTGRPWVTAPDAASLRTRWDRLVRASGEERERLFAPTRARTQLSAVAALPGRSGGTGRFARETGPCPEPVRVLHGPFDEQWLLPDHRLIDVARPELWRVADDRQLFLVEHGRVPNDPGPAVSVTALLPDGHSPAGRPGRVRPLYRRPGGLEPNLAPGLLPALRARYGETVTAESVLAWILAAARSSPAGCVVPLPADAARWADGVELGRELLRLQLRGARGTERPRLPGGQRPYVRAAVPPDPAPLSYDAEERVLGLGTGRVSPVPAGAWEFRVSGVRVLELWFERRTAAPGGAAPGPAGLEAVRPRAWLQEWTSELLELITLLALLAELRPRQEELADALAAGPDTGAEELRATGVLPVAEAARRPASVLDHQEEGPDGQFALL
ncbi:type ISP restriction/modification enzyme [Streptomyces sp. NPDC087866]|uniref:type ISP restriction/modification enzyme n=1 Tax=unclassified Streptomyces TaxID=2593676 RepID=UPI002250563E|nr:type ISP restriction/modification enzyme [Streptomyces sp. NBC_01789]MCX4449991.1 DNA methyltransferase [Streptomyces sp. NBC_01789]